MWIGIDRPEWILLWSGIFGAVFAAAVGALVALLVVGLTNRHQSRASRDHREGEAIADFVAAAEAFEFGIGYSGVEPWEVMIPFRTAYFRLQQASPDLAPIAEIVGVWPMLLANLALASRRFETSNPDLASKCEATLSKAVTRLAVVLPEWRKTKPGERETLLELLREYDEAIRACSAQVDSLGVQNSSPTK